MVDLPGNPVANLSEYELRHLIAHLEECGLVEEIHHLLALETISHSNAWFEVKQAYGDIQGYLEDVSRAWKDAEESYLPTNDSQEIRALGLQVRYALIISSVSSLITNVPPVLLTALVEKGIWTPQLGFFYALHTIYENSRKEALQRLAPYLDTKQIVEAIRIVWDLSKDQLRWLREFLDLAPDIITELLREVLASADIRSQEQVSLEKLLGNALAKLAKQIPDDQVTDAVKVALALSSSAFAALPILLSRLAIQGATKEAMKVANDVRDSRWRARIFNAILPYLSEYDRVSTACGEVYRALQIGFLPEMIETLALLIPHLPYEPQEFRELRNIHQEYFGAVPFTRLVVTKKALEIAHNIDNKLWKAEALSHLASVLPEVERLNILREALSLVKTIEPESYRCQAMEVLVKQLQEPLWSDALDVVKSVQDDFWRCMTLKPLIPFLPDYLLPEVVALLITLENCYIRSEMWGSLAHRFTEPILCELLQANYPAPNEGEDDNKKDEEWNNKAPILEALAPHLPETLVREALAVATPKQRFFQVGEPMRFRKMRGILIPQLARLGFPEEAISAIREHKIDLDAKIVSGIAPYLSEPMLGELLAMVKSMSDGYEKSQAMDRLVPYLSPGLLREALKIVSPIEDSSQLDQAIGKAADWLARLEYTQAAIEIASKIQATTTRASVLKEMIETSSETGRSLIITEALKAARQIEAIEERCKSAAALMPYYPEAEQLSLIGELLNEMENQKQIELRQNGSLLSAKFWRNRQIEILTTLAERLPEDKRQPLLTKALSLARGEEPIVSLPSPDPIKKFAELDLTQQSRIYLLLRLSEHEIIWRFVSALLIIWATDGTERGRNGLFGLLTWLSGLERLSMLLKTYRIAWEIQDKERRAEMFAKLLPLYPKSFIPVVLDQVLASIRLVEDEVRQGLLLNKVMAYVPEDELRKVYRELFRIRPPKSGSHENYEEPYIDMFIELEQNRKSTDSFGSIVRHLIRVILRKLNLKFPNIEPALHPTKVSETFLERLLSGGEDAELRDRAQSLTRIASLLPEIERKSVLNEILEVIHTMNEEYDRADSLLRIFPLCPKDERLYLLEEAFTEIWKCNRKSMVMSSVIDLLPHLTETEKPVALPEIVRVVLEGEKENKWVSSSRGLHELLLYLSESQIREILASVCTSPMEDWKVRVAILAAARLAELGHLPEALEIISEIPNQGVYNVRLKCWGLSRIALSLSEPLARQAIEMARSLPAKEAGDRRARAIALLAFRLAELGHTEEALNILRESISGSLWYAIVLNAMMDLMPEQERTELRIESLSIALSLTDSREERTQCLDATMSQWFSIPADARYSLWKDWLRRSAKRTRADLLADLSSLMPVVGVYGLGSALYETGVAIHDAARWWP